MAVTHVALEGMSVEVDEKRKVFDAVRRATGDEKFDTVLISAGINDLR